MSLPRHTAVAYLFLVRRLTPPRVNTFITLGCLEYHADQRRQFGEGSLRRQWLEQYPQLFDHDDFTRASNRTRPYFFYEWLAAIVLHQSTGFFALVTRYQTDARKRALLPDILPSDVLAVLADRTRWGKTQGPDLLMYAPDYSDWFFCECKGPGDTISDRQHGRFDDLVAAAKKPIRMLEFQLYRPPSPNQTMQRTAGSLRSSLSMKFHPQPAATRHPASRR